MKTVHKFFLLWSLLCKVAFRWINKKYSVEKTKAIGRFV